MERSNAVPPRLGNVLAKSILAALARLQPTEGVGISATPLQQAIADACVLVGYYKSAEHRRLILQNRLYYVRSDGRPGSMLKQDCSVVPKYLLMHHRDKAEFYELENEEPVLADATFLATLGFSLSGETYLVFRLKEAQPLDLGKPKYDAHVYAPYFTKLNESIEQ